MVRPRGQRRLRRLQERRLSSRRALGILATGLVLALSACGNPSTGDTVPSSHENTVQSGVLGSGACAAPEADLSASTVSPGEDVTVSAHSMYEGPCRDFDARSVSATAAPSLPPLPGPAKDVAIVFSQSGADSVVLQTVDANSSGNLEVIVTIPRDASPGPATVRVGIAGEVPIEVVE